MTGSQVSHDDRSNHSGTVARLVDEVEQLRTALETAEEENGRLAEDRDRLLRKLTAQSRELQAANVAYRQANVTRDAERSVERGVSEEQEELRVAFEELQVMTEELEVANTSLQQSNRELDRRVADRTRELAEKNGALTESEARFRTLVEDMPQLVWRAVDGGFWTWASAQWQIYTGQDAESSAGMGWLRALHPDDRDAARRAWDRTEGGAALQFATRIFHLAEQRHRHFQVRATPIEGEVGGPVEWIGTCTDVDELKSLQERQQLLVAELQHRVRNILTVVRSVFSRTADAGGTVEDVAEHFRGRLDSLARTQVIVTQSASGLVNLENLLRDELLSVGVGDGPAVVIEGPEVSLPPKEAESIGLALHELTTNALKYGALKVAGARLKISWLIDRDDGGRRQLHLKWTEQGVPAVPLKPMRQGFGRELILDALPYRLGATTMLEFRGGGVHCAISVPLPEADASATSAWGGV